MNCDRLHPYFDNELDAVTSAEFERHLENCPACVDALDALQSLRASIQTEALYERAPAALHKMHKPVQFHSAWRWLAVAAALLLCVYTGSLMVARLENPLAAELVDAHLRSLQPGHLTDVVSSDQHTVKPWFAGKLDFSPPVQDLAAQGFPLQGGRLEVIAGHAGAALVYGRRKHFVSVFIWPSHSEFSSAGTGSRQGYQWLQWREKDMEFCAVSDASAIELKNLQRLFTQ